MSKYKIDSNPVRANRLRELMSEEQLTQERLAEYIQCSQKTISRNLINCTISEPRAQKIIKAFPQYRLEWLLGYDDYKTVEDYNRHMTITNEFHDAMTKEFNYDRAVNLLFAYVSKRVCEREDIKDPKPLPPSSNANPDYYAFISAQLKDYAEFLYKSYLNNGKTNNAWRECRQLPLKPAKTSRAKDDNKPDNT